MSCTVTHLHTVRDGRKIRSQMSQSWSLPVDSGTGVGHGTLADCNAAHCGLQSHTVKANLDTHPTMGTSQRGQKSKAKAKQQATPPAFAKLQKAMAMGTFALLHNDDSDDKRG
ncbi:hypothetical protein PF005_g6557 [Phytophthora fragariae]|uniref:Uncharacterized protein n=1 Tax=Phytophthora fragariae TaxID=53985 RepID=A0A6A3YPR7_9STRA|nr:hypothetical protein PF003_g27499 [Phytophthora fragariae]KAE9222798.1 hypothetical protein PF005_g6557 [Phytophthora fragariae]